MGYKTPGSYIFFKKETKFRNEVNGEPKFKPLSIIVGKTDVTGIWEKMLGIMLRSQPTGYRILTTIPKGANEARSIYPNNHIFGKTEESLISGDSKDEGYIDWNLKEKEKEALLDDGLIPIPEDYVPRDQIYGSHDHHPTLIRSCYKCNDSIFFGGFLAVNSFSYEQSKKIWKSPHVKLLCCTCFRNKDKFENVIKKKARLIAKAERLWFKFGLDLCVSKNNTENGE